MTPEAMYRNAESAAFSDTAFEPQPDFMFDEPATEDDFHAMQSNIASLNVLSEHNTLHGFQQTLGDGTNSQLQQLPQPSFDQTMFFMDQGDLSSIPPAWSKDQLQAGFLPKSAQADIANSRASVSQHFGQITPPDEHSTAELTGSPSMSNSESSRKSKSERARNAANQRHAKAKEARRDGGQSKGECPVGDEFHESGDRREKYREKNRLAAAKCRAKKKTHTEDLEESARHVTATNNRLRAEERELRDLFSSLRHHALAHDPTQGCNCTAIHTYNHHKAQEAARGAAISLGAMAAIPSPSTNSDGSAVPSPGGLGSTVASRAQSFSGPRAHPRYHSTSRTLAHQAEFARASHADAMMHHQNGISPVDPSEEVSNFSRDLRTLVDAAEV